MSFPYVFVQFLINSNSHNGEKIASQIERKMCQYPIDYQVIKISGKHFFDSLLKERREGRLVVIVGGDGTLNHCISFLEEEDIEIPVAYLPSGLGNDFARSMGLSLDIDEALNHLFSLRQSKKIEIGRAHV